jgi:hypothetical protein
MGVDRERERAEVGEQKHWSNSAGAGALENVKVGSVVGGAVESVLQHARSSSV